MATFLGRALGLDPVTPNPNTYFTDGTYQVGSEVPAQTYRMRQPPPPDEYGTAYCYWARLSGFGGSSDEINGNDFTDVPGIVTIDANEDKGFKSDGCGTWTSDLSPITSSPTAPFTGGTYFVGDDGDIAPGLWRNDGNHDGCYWARLSAFSGSSADILGNDYTDSQATVQIESTDVGFQAASDCGTWTKIG
jgi:hypothetical protein